MLNNFNPLVLFMVFPIAYLTYSIWIAFTLDKNMKANVQQIKDNFNLVNSNIAAQTVSLRNRDLYQSKTKSIAQDLDLLNEQEDTEKQEKLLVLYQILVKLEQENFNQMKLQDYQIQSHQTLLESHNTSLEILRTLYTSFNAVTILLIIILITK